MVGRRCHSAPPQPHCPTLSIPADVIFDSHLNALQKSCFEALSLELPQNRFESIPLHCDLRRYQLLQLMDTIVDINQFPILRKTLTDKTIRKQVRLLSVFGVRASQVIFVTSDDSVYCFGSNRNGCLGLGTRTEEIEIPILNTELSGKQLVAMAAGFEHCVGLTSSGKCWTWGQNKYGQLGVGHNQALLTPHSVQELEEQAIIQISCGSSHTLALTNTGRVFAWGSNTFGQLGDRSYDSSLVPIEVWISGSVRSVCCGKNHSIALTSDGSVFAWGLNEFGQLGRHPDNDIRKGRDKRSCSRPEPIECLSNFRFTKAVCGPNYTLLLTTEGIIYGFGENSNGQIGNGRTGSVVMPFRMANGPQIKDIICYYENDLSMAVSTDNKCYLWGLADNKTFVFPRLITDKSSAYSLFDIYAKYAKHKITYKNVVVTDDMHLEEKMIVQKCLQEYNKNQMGDHSSDSSELNGFSQTNFVNKVNDLNQMKRSDDLNNNDLNTNLWNFNIINEEDDKFSDMENSLIFSIVKDVVNGEGGDRAHNGFPPDMKVFNAGEAKRTIGNLFLSHLRKSFNNKMNYDLKLIIGQKIIYCHKTILEIRNNKFWNILRQRLVRESDQEIRVEPQDYVAFYAFVQYLYGFEPILDDKIVHVLLSLAKTYEETELQDMCDQFIGQLEDTITVDNVCALYQKAIDCSDNKLEESCVNFAAQHWKETVGSEGFQEMQNWISKRLMFAVFDKD